MKSRPCHSSALRQIVEPKAEESGQRREPRPSYPVPFQNDSGACTSRHLYPPVHQRFTAPAASAAAAQRGLTPRSSGAPTARRQARAVVRYILHSPGLAPYRRRSLSSNVRLQKPTTSVLVAVLKTQTQHFSQLRARPPSRKKELSRGGVHSERETIAKWLRWAHEYCQQPQRKPFSV